MRKLVVQQWVTVEGDAPEGFARASVELGGDLEQSLGRVDGQVGGLWGSPGTRSWS